MESDVLPHKLCSYVRPAWLSPAKPSISRNAVVKLWSGSTVDWVHVAVEPKLVSGDLKLLWNSTLSLAKHEAGFVIVLHLCSEGAVLILQCETN